MSVKQWNYNGELTREGHAYPANHFSLHWMFSFLCPTNTSQKEYLLIFWNTDINVIARTYSTGMFTLWEPKYKLSVMTSFYNPGIVEADTGKLLQVRRQSRLHNKTPVSICLPELRQQNCAIMPSLEVYHSYVLCCFHMSSIVRSHMEMVWVAWS